MRKLKKKAEETTHTQTMIIDQPMLRETNPFKGGDLIVPAVLAMALKFWLMATSMSTAISWPRAGRRSR